MDPLASIDDLAARLGGEISPDEVARADALLVGASARVRQYTGQNFTEGESTVTLKVRGGKVRLPQRPVVDVSEVVDANGNDVAHTVAGDVVTVSSNVPDSWSFEPWRNGYETVTVTYSHGHETVPDLIIEVVCQIALRALGRNPTEAGLSSESIDGYSYSIGTIGAAGAVGLLSEEKEVLEPYRRHRGPIRISP